MTTYRAFSCLFHVSCPISPWIGDLSSGRRLDEKAQDWCNRAGNGLPRDWRVCDRPNRANSQDSGSLPIRPQLGCARARRGPAGHTAGRCSISRPRRPARSRRQDVHLVWRRRPKASIAGHRFSPAHPQPPHKPPPIGGGVSIRADMAPSRRVFPDARGDARAPGSGPQPGLMPTHMGWRPISRGRRSLTGRRATTLYPDSRQRSRAARLDICVELWR